MSERTLCRKCHADFGHRPGCSVHIAEIVRDTPLEKPIGCAECGLLGGHARGCSAALPVPVAAAPGYAGLPTVVRHPSAPRGLRALIPTEPLPSDVASQAIVDQMMAAVLAEDARARSCLPAPPRGWHWVASLEARPNGSAAAAEVRVRIAYRLVEG